MIMEYGMSDKLGPMQFGTSQQGQVFLGRDIGHEQNYSDAIAYEIDQEMQNITNACYNRAKELLTEKSKEMHLIANTLLSEETLEMEQIKSLIENGTLPSSVKSKSSSEEVVAESTAEPIIDEIGDVKVRIQPRDEDEVKPSLPEDKPDKPEDPEKN
jgi:cell division protease FtsH